MADIYLDYNATTPIDPLVAEVMLPYVHGLFGNPSSGHSFGQEARLGVDQARAQVSSLLGCDPDDLIFTSGGTEANNHAIKGVAEAHCQRGNHIITSSIEHPAVTEVCRYLERHGFRVTYLPVDEYGMVHPWQVEGAISSETVLVTIMHANNEVGTIQPIAEISEIAHRHGALVHTDCAQSVGKIPVRADELGVDLLSIAGHKLYAPKGIGALFIRPGVRLEKFMHGANHEQDRRAGTENVIEMVGLGKACELIERKSASLCQPHAGDARPPGAGPAGVPGRRQGERSPRRTPAQHLQRGVSGTGSRPHPVHPPHRGGVRRGRLPQRPGAGVPRAGGDEGPHRIRHGDTPLLRRAIHQG